MTSNKRFKNEVLSFQHILTTWEYKNAYRFWRQVSKVEIRDRIISCWIVYEVPHINPISTVHSQISTNTISRQSSLMIILNGWNGNISVITLSNPYRFSLVNLTGNLCYARAVHRSFTTDADGRSNPIQKIMLLSLKHYQRLMFNHISLNSIISFSWYI